MKAIGMTNQRIEIQMAFVVVGVLCLYHSFSTARDLDENWSRNIYKPPVSEETLYRPLYFIQRSAPSRLPGVEFKGSRCELWNRPILASKSLGGCASSKSRDGQVETWNHGGKELKSTDLKDPFSVVLWENSLFWLQNRSLFAVDQVDIRACAISIRTLCAMESLRWWMARVMPAVELHQHFGRN